MNKARKTIKKSIFLSQISIVMASLIITALAFNVCLNIYIRAQAKKQLVSAAGLLHKYITENLPNSDIEQYLNSDEKENIKALLKINKTLKQAQFFLDINYALISKNKNQLAAVQSSEDITMLKQEILPVIKKERLTAAEIRKDNVFYFTAATKDYASVIYPIKLQNAKNIGFILLYSDLVQSKQLVFTVNIILVSIILAAAAFSFIISNILTRKISNPISRLGEFAKQIGNRDYSIPKMNFLDDEIGELGKTMTSMAEKLNSYDTIMKTFLQNASHELRTPLMSIQGYAEGIKYGVVEDEDKAVNIIIDESKRLSGIVEDLLYLNKLEGTHETLNLEQLNAENLLRSCIERVNGIALNSNIYISLNTSYKDIYITVDEEKFSRAIINILANSLRYAEHKINILLEQNNHTVIIKIEDDGCGIPSEDLDKIFDRFYKGKAGKYGLGLAITKTIVEKHGCSITAGNNTNKGAFFNIIL